MKYLLSFIASAILPVCLFAQPGQNDLTFNTVDGVAYGDGSGFDDLVKATALQSDGKILVGGWFNKYNGVNRSLIARLNPDGSNDATFNIGSGFYGAGSELVNAIAVQTDGKILVGGSFDVFNVSNRKCIARLNANGTVDATFTVGTGFNGTVSAVLIQPDGKILVGGSFSQYNGSAANRLVRLNTNGTLDATFSIGTGSTGGVYSLALQPDGKILAGGFFTQFNGISNKYFVRLNANGSIDPTFSTGTGFSYTVNAIAVQTDGKIVTAGEFSSYNGVSAKNIARLNTDGTLDTTFITGTGFNYYVYSLHINAAGKILVAGNFAQYNGTTVGNIVRLDTDGTLDATFTNGTGTVGKIQSVSVQPDGKIVAGGDFSTINGRRQIRIGRFQDDKSLDPTFIAVFGSNSQVVTAAIQPDDKIVIGGDFTAFNEINTNKIARLLPDGALDTTFHTGTGFDSQAYTVTIQPDGKIIAGGYFTTYNGATINEIVRLNQDGTLDNSFATTGTGPNSLVTCTAIQADGKIIVGGWFSSFSSTSKNRIARVNANGTLDATFNPGAGFNDWVYETVLQPDGKVLVGGYFTQFNGVGMDRIARLKTNGSLDTSFHVGIVNSEVLGIALQPDGKILVGGNFTYYQGSRNYINRVNPDGSNDPTFSIGTGFNDGVYSILLQPDGKIVVTGNFTSYNGTPVKRIARLNPDGSIDPTFNPSPGFNDWVFAAGFQSNGKLITGGKFTPLNGSIPRNRVARLFTACPPVSPGIAVTHVSCAGNASGAIDLTPTGAAAPYTCDWGGGVTTEDRTGLTAGTYSVTITDAAGCPSTFTATVTQPAAISASPLVSQITCYGSANGAINLTPSGGTGSYAFSWNDGATTEDRTGLDAGNYSVTISDANGCSTIFSTVITQPASLLTASTAVASVSCFGGTNGAIDLIPSGGMTPYSFLWTDGVTSEDRSGLPAGTYSVTINDSAGCLINQNVTVAQATATFVVSVNASPVNCFGGSDGEIDLTVSGGTMPYSFDWGGGITSEDRTGLNVGTYSVMVSDAQACAILNIPITQPVSPLTASTEMTPVSCNGGANGSIDITASGGTMPYTFAWESGITSEDRSGLIAGSYQVIITDSNGCTITKNTTVTQPAAIVHAFAVSVCYSYTWNGQMYTNSGSYNQVFTASSGCDSTVTLNLTIKQATTSFINQTACNVLVLNGLTYVSSGTYIQHLTNAAGCDSTLTLNLVIHHSSGSSMTQSACNSFTLNGQTYTSSGLYYQHLTNAAGCDSTIELNVTILHSSANSMTHTACGSYTLNGQTYTSSGMYTQQLTNAAGCDSTLTLNLTILQPTSSQLTQTACDSYTLNGQTYTTSGTYIQQLVNSAGCDSVLTLNLTLNEIPVMTVTNNQNGTFTASAASSYQWIDCATGNPVSGAVSQTFAPVINGNYAVIGSTNGLCADTSDCFAITDLKVEENNLTEVLLAPNPTTDRVKIQQLEGTAILRVRDVQGKLLSEGRISSGDELSLKYYADGVYIFELTGERGQTIKRVVKN